MKNWKTTLVGCVGAALTAFVPLLDTGQVSPENLATAATLAVLGVVAKDFNVTGQGR